MLSVFDLRDAGTLDLDLAAYLMARISRGASFMVGAVSGEAGKTTVMCALLNFVPVDLYQFHSGTDEMYDTPGLWDMLHEQVETGKVRHLGISVSKTQGSLYQVDKASEVEAEAIQVFYNRIHRKPEEEVFDSCIRQDLGVLARVPLASGYLSGKYGKEATFAGTDVRSVWQDKDEKREIVEEVMRLKSEVAEGVPMAQWALAWCLQHPAVTCVIPGCKTVEQVESNAKAADLDMVKRDHPQAVL